MPWLGLQTVRKSLGMNVECSRRLYPSLGLLSSRLAPFRSGMEGDARASGFALHVGPERVRARYLPNYIIFDRAEVSCRFLESNVPLLAQALDFEAVLFLERLNGEDLQAYFPNLHTLEVP